MRNQQHVAAIIALLILANPALANNDQLVLKLQELGKGVDAMSANISTATTDVDAQTLVTVTQQTLAAHLAAQQQTVAIDGRAGYCRVEIVGPNWRLWSQAEGGKIVDHGATISGK
jgi:hypothetical protein